MRALASGGNLRDAETTKAGCLRSRLVETEETAGTNRRSWMTFTPNVHSKDGLLLPKLQAPHGAAHEDFRRSLSVVRTRSDQRSGQP
jgi:hypothetical protein